MTATSGEPNNLVKRSERVFDRTEIYLHFMILSATIVIMFLSFTMTIVDRDWVYLPGWRIPLPESCSARIYFGVDCPACGLTRGFISISQGRFSDAWSFNPATYIVYFFFVVQIPWQSYQIWRLRSGQASVDQLWIYYLPFVMTLVLIVQWLFRVL